MCEQLGWCPFSLLLVLWIAAGFYEVSDSPLRRYWPKNVFLLKFSSLCPEACFRRHYLAVKFQKSCRMRGELKMILLPRPNSAPWCFVQGRRLMGKRGPDGLQSVAFDLRRMTSALPPSWNYKGVCRLVTDTSWDNCHWQECELGFGGWGLGVVGLRVSSTFKLQAPAQYSAVKSPVSLRCEYCKTFCFSCFISFSFLF